jgi:tRNA C32,U32 (ribose-2'-O)-methylase TrmJ
VLSQVDSMLRGKVSNASAPLSYSSWNLAPAVSVVAYEFLRL